MSFLGTCIIPEPFETSEFKLVCAKLVVTFATLVVYGFIFVLAIQAVRMQSFGQLWFSSSLFFEYGACLAKLNNASNFLFINMFG